jgi:hypothetical protein
MKWGSTWLCIHTDIGTKKEYMAEPRVQNLFCDKNPYTKKEKENFSWADSFLGINFFTGHHELLRGDIIGLLPGTSVQG